MNKPISWSLLDAALEEYSGNFDYLEVPWIIGRKATDCTRPKEFPPMELWSNSFLNGDLVASGEQGFIQLALDGVLSPGRYVTLTPCFRPDEPDELHQRYFAKVELIVWEPETLQLNPNTELNQILFDAKSFMEKYTGVDIKPIGWNQIDLVHRATGIELGSYGIRSANGFTWVYGTGLAEPRFSSTYTRVS